MSDLRRRSFHERSKLWGSFKKRLSGSARRVSMMNDRKNNKVDADAVVVAAAAGTSSRPLSSYKKNERLNAAKATPTPKQQARRRSERGRSTSRTRKAATATTTAATKSEQPVTCLPTRNNANTSPRSTAVAFPSFFHCGTSARQHFARMDDDTFSTNPIVGLASRYSRHYSDIWLAEEKDARAQKAPRDRSGVESGDPAKEEPSRITSLPLPFKKKEHTLSPRNIGILEKEIGRLTSALNKAILTDTTYNNVLSTKNNDARRNQSRQHHHLVHNSEFVDVTTTATDLSISTTTVSEFSFQAFQADFSEWLVVPTRGQEESHLTEEAPVVRSRTAAPQVVDATQFAPKSEAVRRVENTQPKLEEQAAADNSRPSQNVSKREYAPKVPSHDDSTRINFQPILAESTHNNDIYEYKNPAWGVKDLLESGLRLTNATTTNDAKAKAQSIFRSSRQMAGRDWHKHYHDSHMIHDEKEESTCVVDQQGGGDDVFVTQICFSQDESHVLSEMTDTVSTAEYLYHNNQEYEIRYDQHHNDNSHQRKARCVVFYNQPLSESDHKLTCNVPVKVKDVVSKFEALKQMEIEHAEKFGYKGFLPIAEQHKREFHSRAYASYEETAQKHYNAECINMKGSESFSL